MSDTSDPSVSFGVELRRRRIAAGISLTEFASRLHYSKSHLSKVENGSKGVSVELARLCDAVLHAGGQLVALMPAPERATRLQHPVSEPLIGGPEALEWPAFAASLQPAGDEAAAAQALVAFQNQLESLRDLGQTLGPSLIIPILVPNYTALQQLARRVESAQARESLILAARFAEFAGWMTQELGDDLGALHWTDKAVELARTAGDNDMVAYAFVRRANIAMYQQDAYGTITFARQAQEMECSERVRGLAAQREAQGHALAGDADGFYRCMSLAAELLESSRLSAGGRPVLGSARMPDTVALATGWSLYDLGRPAEAVRVLDPLFDRTPKRTSRAWARTGARLALSLAAQGEVERACAIAQPILVLFPVIESATIRSDLRQLARLLNRWHSNPSVRGIMPDLSAALTPAPKAESMLLKPPSGA